MAHDPERNRLSARVGRAAKVGANLSGAAAAFAGARVFGGEGADQQIAAAIKAALGRTKGPLMKVAQMLATIPDLLPPDYAAALATLQSGAPAMGWPFVQRRMRAELGPDWEGKFHTFERTAAAAASLGQVHKALGHDGRTLACKLQYPDMTSAVESDLSQLHAILATVKRFARVVDPTEIGEEIADRLREELDYGREAKHMALYRAMLAETAHVAAPEPIPALSTNRLLTMTWLEGRPLAAFEGADQQTRNRIATLLFKAWWTPFGQYGIIHGDPHLGNYSFAGEGGETLNLLDFGCVRIFPPSFVGGVLALRDALEKDDHAGVAKAYADWGFADLKAELIEALNIWARFMFAPLLDRRVRRIAEGVKPSEYGRREVWRMKQMLAEHGPVAIPREFVFMDRAAIGLGAAFLRLGAELNFAQLFDEATAGFSVPAMAARQRAALAAAGLA
jgi:predicted unusual protein kinase regulating ubiquinone biosynthesis (AarF/ABC1/UbiB family)